MPQYNTLKRDVCALLVIGLCALFLFFYRLGARPLWDYDEAMHAQVAREMLERGDWCTPVFNGQNFYNKPVMHFWLVMASFLLLGFSEFSARLPSAIMGLAGIVLVYFWGRRAYGRVAGILASLILATSIEYVILSQNIIHDITLCFFVNLALFQFHSAMAEKTLPFSAVIFIALAMGCAVLSKGPVGLLLPGTVILLFVLITKRWLLVINRRLFIGILIFLLVAVPWFVLMALRHDDYIKSFLLEGNLGRFFSRGAPHKEPVYYYLPVVLVGFFPWSVFLPSVLYVQIKDYVRKKSPDVLFLLLAAGVPFVFFSLARSKLATYILLIFPALSLLAGKFFADLRRPEVYTCLKAHFKYSSWAFFLIVCIAAVGGVFYTNTAYPQYVFPALGAGAFMIFSSLVFLASSFSRKIMVSCAIMTLFMTSAVMGINSFVLPAFSQFKSLPHLAATLRNLMPPHEPVFFYRDLRESVIFYTNRRGVIIKKSEELEAFLNSPRTVYCVIAVKQYNKLKQTLQAPLYSVAREGNHMVISNTDPKQSNKGAVA